MTATTWRDFAEQLTAEQIAAIEHCEQQVPPGVDTSAHYIDTALAYISDNEAQAACAHIPTPADALGEPSHWISWGESDHARTYTCWALEVGGFEVQISAWQFSDGRPAEREILFEDTDGQDMTAGRARLLGQLLVEAADTLDRLNAEDQR